MSEVPKVTVSNLWKVFGHRTSAAIESAERGASRSDILAETRATVALRDVSLDIPAGRTFIIMGLSGSGKSTMVRCLNRLIEPTRGVVTLDGEDITAMSPTELRQVRRDRFGMVFQNFALLPHRDVTANVAFGLELQGVALDERTEKARETLGLVGLDGWGDSYPDELSGGMQQRVGLARALAGDPDVLLMDEPFSALDPLMRTQMQDELLDLQTRLRKTIIFITHDLDEAIKLGSQIAILRDGEVAQLDSPDEILRNPADDYVASFVENVDRSHVLQAKDVMFRPNDLVRPGHAPEVALRMMEQEGRSASFVMGREGELLGIVTADAALTAVQRGHADVSEVINPDVQTTTPDTPIAELVATMTTQPYPIAVIDGGRFVGVVARISLVRALAERRIKRARSGAG